MEQAIVAYSRHKSQIYTESSRDSERHEFGQDAQNMLADNKYSVDSDNGTSHVHRDDHTDSLDNPAKLVPVKP